MMMQATVKRSTGALALLLVAAALLGGCGSAQRFNDAVRIKPDQAGSYGVVPGGAAVARDGRTLRGTVKQVVIAPSPKQEGTIDTFYVFLDARAEDRPENYELIPLRDIERVGSLMNLPRDTVTDNINVVESFNNTEMIPQLRRVPMAVYRAGPPKPSENGGGGGDNCNCEPLSFSFSLPEIECPKREYSWFFAEGRVVYANFVDLRHNRSEIARQTISGDLALGVRLGAGREWGVGLLASMGNMVNDIGADPETATPRTSVMGHVRYQTPGPVTSLLGICMKPFFYGNLGVALDEASISLMKIKLNTECQACQPVIDAAVEANPSVDLSFPISFGFGFGAEFPVASWLDIGVDIGYRRLSIADEVLAGPIANLPSRRSLDMFLLRFGATY